MTRHLGTTSRLIVGAPLALPLVALVPLAGGLERSIAVLCTVFMVCVALVWLFGLHRLRDGEPVYLAWAGAFTVILVNHAFGLHQRLAELVLDEAARATSAGLSSHGIVITWASVGAVVAMAVLFAHRRSDDRAREDSRAIGRLAAGVVGLATGLAAVDVVIASPLIETAIVHGKLCSIILLTTVVGRRWAAVRAVTTPPDPALDGAPGQGVVELVDRFDRADTATLGSAWMTKMGRLSIVANRMRPADVGVDSTARRGELSRADGYVQAVVNVAAEAYCGIQARDTGSTARNEVSAEINPARRYSLVEFVDGREMLVAQSAAGAVPTDVDILLRLEVVKSTARLFADGRMILSGTITTQLLGTAVGAGGLGDVTIGEFEAGTFAEGGSVGVGRTETPVLSVENGPIGPKSKHRTRATVSVLRR